MAQPPVLDRLDSRRLETREGIRSFGKQAEVVEAGAGERVLLLDEGNGARQIFDIPTGPIRSVVVGIVDSVTGLDGD